MPVVDVHGDLNAACVQAALSRRQSFLLAESKALHRRDEYCGSGFAGTPAGQLVGHGRLRRCDFFSLLGQSIWFRGTTAPVDPQFDRESTSRLYPLP